MKRLAFIQEDFHSEVLDFLFELINEIDKDIKMILYNTIDRYDNKKLYLEKYTNLEVRNLKNFIPDLISDVFDKVIIASYDNIFHLELLQNYKEKFIYIAHSEKHVRSFNLLEMSYFSLTPLLDKEKYMLPIVNKTSGPKLAKTISYDIYNNIRYLQSVAQNDNLEIIITVGYFFQHNKDLPLINKLLDSKKILLLVFSPEMSNELSYYVKKYPKNVFYGNSIPTELIKHYITFLKIKYLLFCPPKNSSYVKNSWSGTIAFGIDNLLHLILPKEIAEIYGLIGIEKIVPYKDSDDILIEINNKNDNINSLQKWKDDIFIKNKKLLQNLICF